MSTKGFYLTSFLRQLKYSPSNPEKRHGRSLFYEHSIPAFIPAIRPVTRALVILNPPV